MIPWASEESKSLQGKRVLDLLRSLSDWFGCQEAVRADKCHRGVEEPPIVVQEGAECA